MHSKLIAAAGVFLLVSCTRIVEPPEPQQTMVIAPAPAEWNAWAHWADKKYPIGDDQGHGPDIGSDEWASAMDKRLGISVGGHGPDLKSSEWRRAVESRLAMLDQNKTAN